MLLAIACLLLRPQLPALPDRCATLLVTAFPSLLQLLVGACPDKYQLTAFAHGPELTQQLQLAPELQVPELQAPELQAPARTLRPLPAPAELTCPALV